MLIKDPPVQVTESLWMLGSNEYPLYLMRGEEEAAIFEEFKQVAASQVGTPAKEPEAPESEPAAPASSEAPTRAASKAPPAPPRKEKDESARPELG